MADRLSLAQHYHERTKYVPNNLASVDLDWSKQPTPFKDYKIGAVFDLKPHLALEPADSDDQRAWQRLSRLLLNSYGLTVRMMTLNGDLVYLRSAPSAGGLYPAELYLISRGTPLLPVGLYSYQPKSHTLVRFWDSDRWTELQSACFWHPSLDATQLALVVTSIFERSAWRYRDRAYRRIALDSGHLLGNIELASAITDFRPHVIGGFMDEWLDDLLYLNSEQEGTLAVVALADRLEVRENLPLLPTALPSPTQHDFAIVPDGQLLYSLHQASRIPKAPQSAAVKDLLPAPALALGDKYNFPFCLKKPTATLPIAWGKALSELDSTMLKRRSTRAYSGANLTFDELKALLDFTYQPQNYLDQGLDPDPDYFDLSLIETFIAVSGVDGLEEGCYYYATQAQELRQIRFKNFRRELHRLCLGQNLGRDAAAVLFHTADLSQAIDRYGDRAYRYLHMDAGHLGQRLNLAAIHLGLGVSGIAGFFDDEVNEVLGIPSDEAALYITTLGRPK